MGITSSYSLLLRCFLLCLVIVGGLCSASDGRDHQTTRPAAASVSSWSAERGKAVDHAKLDINYISKRRVPNGPDPIHNRRAGSSGRPPGQA